MSKKALLIICDGWGIGDKGKDDVIFNTPTPYWDELLKTYPASQLQASGENVGLPDGQMGNSEVGHLNIGAGRIVYQDLVKINIACRENTIMENPEIKRAYSYAKENNKQIHFMGLVSDGGVHSSLEHLLKLTDIAKEYGISKAYVHCFMDGRDTDPKSGKGFIETLENHLKTTGGKIASIIGRYYAMDRDKRWERVKEAYDLLVEGKGKQAECMVKAMEESYAEGGRETPFDSEERILVPSPKVATYDLKPEMSAFEVKDKLVDAINTKKFDFIVVNYANGDMVGHTGVYKAIEKAVVTIDACLHDTVEAAKANDYEVIIIADHGNADHALNEDGTPNTAHSLNPVPFVYVTANKDAKVEDGILADVAPSILHILGLKQPKEMTGKSLIK